MKKLISLTLAFVLCVAVMPVTAMAAPGDEWSDVAVTTWYSAGASEYTITSAEELAGFAKLVNEGNDFSEKTIKLEPDSGRAIDLEGKNWTPIGSRDLNKAFNGTFDGKICAIKNLQAVFTQADAPGQLGVFGYIGKSGIVKNLNTDGDFTMKTTATTNASAGAIVGENKGSVENCRSFANIESNKYVGGIAGVNTGTIYHCTNIGNIELTTTSVGYAAGGIVGWNANGELNMCLNEGSISYMGNAQNITLGGIVGLSTPGTFQNVINVGIIGEAKFVGGILGNGSATIKYGYSIGELTANEEPDSKAAIAIAQAQANSTIKNIYYPVDSYELIGTDLSLVTVIDSKAMTIEEARDPTKLLKWLQMASAGSDAQWYIDEDFLFGFPMFMPGETPVEKISGDGPSYYELEYNHFSDTIKEQIKAINSGKAKENDKYIDVDAKIFERFPVGLVDTLYGKDMIIRIAKEGKVYEVDCKDLPISGNNRMFYTVDYMISLAK